MIQRLFWRVRMLPKPSWRRSKRTTASINRSLCSTSTIYGPWRALISASRLESGRPALTVVVEALPVTLQLTVMAMLLTIAICLPLGAWLGIYQMRGSRRVANLIVFLAQGVPGFVAGLFSHPVVVGKTGLVAVDRSRRTRTWVLPTLTLASFLVPKLTRVISTKVSETLSKDYIRTALAYGSSPRAVLWRHALPNALLVRLRSSVRSSRTWFRAR